MIAMFLLINYSTKRREKYIPERNTISYSVTKNALNNVTPRNSSLNFKMTYLFWK